jgi:hypothetical protein
MWLAWWIVQVDSHSALRVSAFSKSRRSGVCGMAITCVAIAEVYDGQQPRNSQSLAAQRFELG